MVPSLICEPLTAALALYSADHCRALLLSRPRSAAARAAVHFRRSRPDWALAAVDEISPSAVDAANSLAALPAGVVFLALALLILYLHLRTPPAREGTPQTR